MEINKDVILNYLKSDREKNNYIIALYKNYVTLNKYFGENCKINIKVLQAFEDEIYKIKGKTLSEERRVSFEVELIKRKLQEDKGCYDFLVDTFGELEQLVNSTDFSNFDETTNLKKKISVFQSKLNIRPSFLYASYLAFEDSYRNIYINHIKQNENNFRGGRFK